MIYILSDDIIVNVGKTYYSRAGTSPSFTYSAIGSPSGNPHQSMYFELKNPRYDTVYVNGIPFPYTPVHDAGQNDVDLDAYTNLDGKTVRNRIRADVKTLDFNLSTMNGQEMKDLMDMRKPVWFNATFFDESEWAIITRKMYCSSPKYTKDYIDNLDPLKNRYTSIQFGFVEE